MLPLLTSDQIRQGDAWTIEHEPISSVDLMERASKAFVGWFVNHFTDKKQRISIYCGTGNNGGDGLAVARLLCTQGYCNIQVKIARFSDKATDDFNINLDRLKQTDIAVNEIEKDEQIPAENAAIIIDALLGTGLNKPLQGDYEHLVKFLNDIKATKASIDIPTGFLAEGDIDPDATIFKSDLTITFQQPKINFLLPESKPYIDCLEVVNIGIDENFIASLDSPYQFIEKKDVKAKLRPRHRFSNKGTYGHALIIAGQPETMGAALLSASSCVYAGAGLTTACIPESGLTALNCHLPEIMAIVRKGDAHPVIEYDKFSVIGIGPGLGKDDYALALLTDVITNYRKPIVVDADALNILSTHKPLLAQLPEGSILTPHMKEFDRLFGGHKTWWQRLQTAKQKAQEMKIVILLKNDYTIVASPDGKLYFNSTSNAAMAVGGMGDVLAGIITALLAQKYPPVDAAVLGAYIHGKAGDELALPNRMMVVLPSKLTEQLPLTMAKLLA